MSGEEPMSLLEKRFLEDYNLLATEAEKYPRVKEACETGQIRVRNASSTRMLAAMGLRAAMTSESQQILEPFFMGCDTKAPKMVQISINAMQKMIILEYLNTATISNLLNCLWNLMEHGIEEMKILQTVTLLVTTNQLVVSEQLAKTISLCFRLRCTKNATINNAASAKICQLVTVIFERVQNEDKKETPPPTDVDSSKSEKMFESTSSRYKPVLLRPAATDAFNFLQDLIQIINGEEPFWLTVSDQHHRIEITKTFGQELLELIIDHYAVVFYKHKEFAFLLKEKAGHLVQRDGAQFSLLSPLLSKAATAPGSPETATNSTNASPSASSTSSTTGAPMATSSVQLSQSSFWPKYKSTIQSSYPTTLHVDEEWYQECYRRMKPPSKITIDDLKSFNSNSQYSNSNPATNPPNLLSQQSSSQPQQGQSDVNPNNPIVNSNITSMDNLDGAGSIQEDFSQQSIVVDTPILDDAAAPIASTSGGQKRRLMPPRKVKKTNGGGGGGHESDDNEDSVSARSEKPTRGRTAKRMRKDKAAEDEGGHESENDGADSVSDKSEIESDERGCNSNNEDYSDFEVEEDVPGEDGDDAAASVASTSRGRKRQAAPTRKVAAKKRRMDTEDDEEEEEESAGGSGNFKMKIITINCTVADCQRNFSSVRKMREHLLAVHNVKPFPCHAQGCGQQFDKRGELSRHGAIHSRATTTWICPHCPAKTFTNGSNTSTHIYKYHQTGQFQCTVGQCQFIGTTRIKVQIHQKWVHSTAQHTCPFEGCTRSFKTKQNLTQHQLTHTSTKPYHCTFVDCGYEAKQRGQVDRHIRMVHFHLPATRKKQDNLGIVDHRDPNEYIEVDEEALRSALQQ